MPTPAEQLSAAAAALERREVLRARAIVDPLAANPALDPATRARALHLAARIAEVQGDLDTTVARLESAAALVPRDAQLWVDLGLALAAGGNPARARPALERALALDARQPRVWNNLGSALWALGERGPSIEAFRRATTLAPDYAHAFANLGTALHEAGDAASAEQALQRAIALEPGNVGALATLASMRQHSGQLPEAIRLYIEAVRRSPGDANLCVLLARALAAADDVEGARRVFAEALRRDPRTLRAHIGNALSLPSVPADEAEVARNRAGYAEGLSTLERELPVAAQGLAHDERVDALRWCNFLLAYQGEDDRELQRRYGRLVESLTGADAPPMRAPREPRGRTRVSFVSSFFRDGTIGRYFASWITDVDRSRYEVVVYHLHPVEDALVAGLRGHADVFRALTGAKPSTVARALRQDAPDVIVYPELGMDASMFVLGSLRLAPLQCAGWGHPVTTGFPAIDLFFTSDAMEPPGGEQHYTETLVRLPGIGTRYAMPEAPLALSRAELDLPEDRVLFLCPQSVFKMHPRDDARLVEVLRRVEGTMLVLFADPNPFLQQRFQQRFVRSLDEAGVDPARVLALPSMRHDRYMAVNAACDAMLDTSRWSGGNTSLDAIAAGLPIVTQPGTLMRARQSAGMLRLMGLDALVAGDDEAFYALAARLARDRAFRDAQSRAMVEARARIFDDPAPVPALYRAIDAALAARRG